MGDQPLSPTMDHDQIDDLFDYDVGLEDITQEPPTTSNNNASKPSAKPDGSGLGLGLDEEVKVTKKRQPIAKLDENRLLSQPGIPKLRKSAKQKLRFKGKGHEFSDAARLLNFYQLWLDDLYPRAKFADALTMIEKLGHSKRIQTMRREWIDEEKPGRQGEEPEDSIEKTRETAPTTNSDDTNPNAEKSQSGDNSSMANGNAQPSGSSRPRNGTGQNSLSDALFMSDDENDIPPPAVEQTAPEDDVELDALLREQENDIPTTNKQSTAPAPNLPAGDDDDLEELLREQDEAPATNKTPAAPGPSLFGPDDDDLDALLREQEDEIPE